MTDTAPAPNEVEQKRLDLVHNEQAKLTATWLNNLGVGSIVAGFIAPSHADCFGHITAPSRACCRDDLDFHWYGTTFNGTIGTEGTETINEFLIYSVVYGLGVLAAGYGVYRWAVLDR